MIKNYKRRIINLFNGLKEKNGKEILGKSLPVKNNKKIIANLKVVSKDLINDKQLIGNLAQWRKLHSYWFPSQFKVTKTGTKKWLKNQLIDVPDRILFIIETPDGQEIGHLGLNRFNFTDLSCEIDNVVRGNGLLPGIMTKALRVLINWSFFHLGIKTLYLRTFADNKRAIKLYKKTGFKELEKIPLNKIIKNNTIQWVEILNVKKSPVDRYHLKMYLNNTHL